MYQISHVVFPVDARCLYSTRCMFRQPLKPFSKSLLAQSYAPSSTPLPTVCQTGLKTLHLHLSLRQEHTQLHFTTCSSSCLLESSGFPCCSQLLKPGIRDAASWFCLLTPNATEAGWESPPPLLAWKTSHWFSSDFAGFWVPYMANESAQRSGGSSLFTQTWERSTGTWALSQPGHNTSLTLDKSIQEAHIKGAGTGSRESKDIQPSPQLSWKLPHLSPLLRIISFIRFNSQNCHRIGGFGTTLLESVHAVQESHPLFTKDAQPNEGYAIIPLNPKSLFQGLIKMT